MSERESIRLPGGQIMYLPTDEEDAEIRAAIESDPDQREDDPQPPGTFYGPGTLPYRMREAALRKAREREAAAQADKEDE